MIGLDIFVSGSWFLKSALSVFEAQFGHLPGNCHLIGCSIRFSHHPLPLPTPVWTLLNLFSVARGNVYSRLFQPVLIWFHWGGKSSLPSWKRNSLLQHLRLWPWCRWWRWSAAGRGYPDCGIAFFFRLQQQFHPRDIAVAISESWKSALKLRMTQYVFPSHCRFGWEALGAGGGSRLAFPKINQTLLSLQTLFIVEHNPLFHCRTDPYAFTRSSLPGVVSARQLERGSFLHDLTRGH